MLFDFKRPSSHIKYLSSLTSDAWIKLALSNTIDILSIHDIIVSDHNTEDFLSVSPEKSFSGITDDEKWKSLYNEISDNTSSEVLSDVKAQFSTDHKKLYQNFNFYLIEVVPILDEFVECRKNIQ